MTSFTLQLLQFFIAVAVVELWDWNWIWEVHYKQRKVPSHYKDLQVFPNNTVNIVRADQLRLFHIFMFLCFYGLSCLIYNEWMKKLPACMRVAWECTSCLRRWTVLAANQRLTHDWTRITLRRSVSTNDISSSSWLYLKNTYNTDKTLVMVPVDTRRCTEISNAWFTLQTHTRQDSLDLCVTAVWKTTVGAEGLVNMIGHWRNFYMQTCTGSMWQAQTLYHSPRQNVEVPDRPLSVIWQTAVCDNAGCQWLRSAHRRQLSTQYTRLMGVLHCRSDCWIHFRMTSETTHTECSHCKQLFLYNISAPSAFL